MKYLKKFESVFDNIPNLLEISEFRNVYDELMKNVKKEDLDIFVLEFDDQDSEIKSIKFPTIEVVNFGTHQFSRQYWRYIMQQKNSGKILIQHTNDIPHAGKSHLYKIENIETVEDAIEKLKQSFERLYDIYMKYVNGKAKMQTAQQDYTKAA